MFCILYANISVLVLQDLESKWLTKTEEPCRTPEIENMDMDTYHRSLARYINHNQKYTHCMNHLDHD